MVTIFRRQSGQTEVTRHRPRPPRQGAAQVNRVALAELTPDLAAFLGQAAYLQLSIFETASLAVSTAPHSHGKNSMSRVARQSLDKYEGLVSEMKRANLDPVATMERFSSGTERYRVTTSGADWFESLVTTYVTAGLLDDFFVRLAAGLPPEPGSRIGVLLDRGDGASFIADELQGAITHDPILASRLALWGRRLVGDTLLVARSALNVPENTAPDEARLEPVFTELIANHTRRMDALGLTA